MSRTHLHRTSPMLTMQYSKGSFKHSAVAGSSSKGNIHSVRTSQSTSIQRDDVVRCIEARALAFQGLDAEDAYTSSRLEPVQLVKYAATEHFHYHTDWFTDPAHAAASLGGNRQSSFFAYVKADNVTGGGTNFPLLDAPGRRAEDGGEGWWCRAGFLDCDAEYEDGVTFRPVEGNAVFWANLHEGGQGDGRTLHAGLPLVAGEKIGMNIWTRQAALPAEVRGE